jgi:Rne/Rng family ribonuclease
VGNQAGHAFISYVREDSDAVDELQEVLEAAGVPVWRDTADLWPGEDWRAKIREAITRDALAFIACFSSHSAARQKSFQNEELYLAIDQLRMRRPNEPWLIPVRFDDCDVPELDIGSGRTLGSIHRADLFGERSAEAVSRLVSAVQRILGLDPGARRQADQTSMRRHTRAELSLADFYADADQVRAFEGLERSIRSGFLARREAVERMMLVRLVDDCTEIAILENGVLVEHYVDQASRQSFVGNVYLGKVQNVLPSMEAAFVDIGQGRNAVLYAGDVNFDASGLKGAAKRIESVLKSGQSIMVQVAKDPLGYKGARLTSEISLPGRYLVYVPGASMTGISRKLPDAERRRLRQLLTGVVPEGSGIIVRATAKGASEEDLRHDVTYLVAQWHSIESEAKAARAPELLHSEPDVTIRVIRDLFNEDFTKLVIADEGDRVEEYVRHVAPNLAGRLEQWTGDKDLFAAYRIDEERAKALDRTIRLPSGGSLVIDTTDAMTVIDVNPGTFTGNLEQTVATSNLEAAKEIVRQLRLRDIDGRIAIDFIDMELRSNRDLVLRRLIECLTWDRAETRVHEVTSLGLVQMTRRRV